MLESYSMQQKEVEYLALIWRKRKGRKKGYKKGENEELSLGNKYFNKVKYFRCHYLGYYVD